MVYCQRCGKKNEEGASFCNKCGASLVGPFKPYHERDYGKEWENRCDEECSGKHKTPLWSTFWILFLALVAIGIFITLISRIFHSHMPDWMPGVDYWDIFWLLAALLVVSFILYALATTRRHQ